MNLHTEPYNLTRKLKHWTLNLGLPTLVPHDARSLHTKHFILNSMAELQGGKAKGGNEEDHGMPKKLAAIMDQDFSDPGNHIPKFQVAGSLVQNRQHWGEKEKFPYTKRLGNDLEIQDHLPKPGTRNPKPDTPRTARVLPPVPDPKAGLGSGG